MINDEKIYSDGVPQLRCKHVSLTHYFCRSNSYDQRTIKEILWKCDVSPYVGQLPPELRVCVPYANISEYTHRFHEMLSDFLVENYRRIITARQDGTLLLRGAAELFQSSCIVEYKGADEYGHGPWHGAVGVVCKLSFPKLNAAYALKIFLNFPYEIKGHGALYEIPCAFGANHAEPNDNNNVYMASLSGDMYMLSKWADDKSNIGDGTEQIMRHNENEMFFVKRPYEIGSRNYINGRRIDFGAVSYTMYGRSPYHIRKLYRILKYAALHGDEQAVAAVFKNCKSYSARQILNSALDLLIADAANNSDQNMYKILTRDWQR